MRRTSLSRRLGGANGWDRHRSAARGGCHCDLFFHIFASIWAEPGLCLSHLVPGTVAAWRRLQVRFPCPMPEPESATLLTARSDDGRLPVFAYVDTVKAGLYRAIMRIFIRAKERFSLHLRPEDVLGELVGAGQFAEPEEVDAALKQLRSWENLRADPDTADVETVEEFYRERLLYQLTRRGEAAERALMVFEELVAVPGELQTSALVDIRAHLSELDTLAVAQPLDAAKIHRSLQALYARFEELTGKAQIFIGSLQRSVDLQTADEDVFLAYKERLIDYLQRFVGDLTLASVDIGAMLRRLEPRVPSLLDAAAERSVADRLDADANALTETRAVWEGRWQGVLRWFVNDGSERSQADVLRVRALGAIPALLGAAQALHDRRVRRADRHQDFMTLARWFAETADDAAANRLWRAAFGLAPARHLWVTDESVAEWDGVATARSSWLDAPPLRIAPRLRVSGRYDRPGGPRAVVSRATEREKLAAVAASEHQQLDAARRWLIGRGRCRLSDVGLMDRPVFELLLDLLGSALAETTSEELRLEATSTDGSLTVHLELVDEGVAEVATVDGTLRCRDYMIEIVDAIADGKALTAAE